MSTILEKIAPWLFVAALALLPAAEWRCVVLPVSGKPLSFDPMGQGSASPFDLVFLFFCLAILPRAIRSLSRAGSLRLTHWIAALSLLLVLLFTNEFVSVFLTPAIRKVVDARSLLIHFVVMAATAVYVSRMRLETLIRGTFLFYAASATGFAVLSYLALSGFPFFRFHYPFQSPTLIAFPFPNYNVAAPFITVTCLGLVGSAFYLRRPLAIVVALPVFILATALTGSRSSLIVLIFALAVLACVLAVYPRQEARQALPVYSTALLSSIAVLIAGVAIVSSHDLPPVRRALSILGDIADDPGVLLRGQKGSPRQEMWELARARTDLSRFDDDRDFNLILTAIHDGCVANSDPIRNLTPGRDYWVRLTQRFDVASPAARLEVYGDRAGTQLIGTTHLSTKAQPLPYLFMYVADSGRRYVIQSGSVGAFHLDIDDTAFPAERLMPSTAVSYFDPVNGSPGLPVEIRQEEVLVAAKDRKIRGFVSAAGKMPAPRERLVLEYRLRLDHVTYTLPLDPPTMFYVGLHDTALTAEGDEWTRIRNGLLVQHRRETTGWERTVFGTGDLENVWGQYPDSSPAELRARYENFLRVRKCDASGTQAIADIWKTFEGYDANRLSFEKVYGARVRPGRPEDLSVHSDPSWSSERHLKYGGSTHNVYLDWYYYEGPIALALFLLFVITFLCSLAACVWRLRKSRQGVLVLTVSFQVAVIMVLMYAQPYIWIKYYWVVFGVASGLLIHGELSGAAAARESDA